MVESLIYAKGNGIVMLSIPPHTLHKLQPLNLAVYGPLKHYIIEAFGAWMKNNPGCTMKFRPILETVKEALPLALIPRNIMAKFRKAGVAPCNRNVFIDEEFAPSYVTDRLRGPTPNEFLQEIVKTPIES